ncbi:MAG TPA: succinate dehydrogenase cytochrome b558 subunit [Pirellulales bacterium]|nr:succinate dehydrogenase cytochrome b558 subunit [Pirellulales bacterium]
MDNLPSASFFSRHEFLIRRLHSLSGIIPVGAYMCVHLATNASTLAGAETFLANVTSIHALGPLLPLVEWTFIFLPIIFHAVVGVVIIRTGSQNTAAYPYSGNVRYFLQRATAWIALFFIFWHVFHMHGWIHADWWHEHVSGPLAGAKFDPYLASSSAYMALAPLAVRVLYAIGVLSCVYHLANGLWTSGITWGLWTTVPAQRRANYVCAAFGILLAAVGMAALVGVSSTNVLNAMAVEELHIQKQLDDLRVQQQKGPTPQIDREIAVLEGELKKLERIRSNYQPSPKNTATGGDPNRSAAATGEKI